MKRTSLLFIFALAALMMTATQFSQEQAKHVAEQFVKQKVGKNASIREIKSLPINQARFSAASNDGEVASYAVNLDNNDGFVLVVGNDQSNDILGYCDHGTFNEQQMPSNMRSWLESYMACAAAVKDVNTSHALRSAPGVPTKTPIAPLLICQWNQDAPYNDQCPVIDGQHCATGCTNTAIAQVMFYHKWPAGTTATIPSYIPDNSGGTHYPTLPALEPTTFDWSKMYPTYKNGEDGTEVARLFKYLGTASLTNYGKESGATGYNALLGIIKYFDYDASASTVWRRQRSYQEWIDMLYAELQAKRPVMFSGTSPDGAHSFVVDGYDEEDFFHVNWGWGGYSDGYYRVLLMDPNEQGIGGNPNNDNYSMDQVAFFGVKPNEGGTATPPRVTVLNNWLLCDAQGNYTYDTQGMESTSPFFENEGYLVYAMMDCHSFNPVTDVFELGCRLVKDDGSVTRDYPWEESVNFIPNSRCDDLKKDMHINPIADPGLTDGDYKMYFISKLRTSDTWLVDDGSENHYMLIHLDHANNKLTAKAVNNDAQLSVEQVKVITSKPTVGTPCELMVTVKNDGPVAYHGDLGITQDDGWLDAIGIDLEPGKTIDVGLSFKPKKAGDMKYYVQDNRNFVLYTGTLSVAETNQSSNCDLTITHRVTNAEGTEIAAPKAKLDLTVTNNSDKDYYGAIYIYCFKYNGEEGNLVQESSPETIPAHQTVVLHRESPELTGGESYRFSTMYIRNGTEIEQDIPEVYYTTVPYYYTYDAEGKESTKRATAVLQPDASECAIDLTVAPEVTSVISSANPNLIIVASEDSPFTGDNVVKNEQAQNIKLIDGYPFYAPCIIKAQHVSYTLTPERYFDIKEEKGWTTLNLPFAATSCQATINGVATPLRWYTDNTDGELMVVTFKYENGSELFFGFPETTLNANHPYLLGVPSTLNESTSLVNAPITFSADNAEVTIANSAITGLEYKMKGTLTPIRDVKDIYVLNTDGSAFVLGTYSVNPFHAFCVPIGSQNPASQLTIKLTFDTDTPTGINGILDNTTNDLQGPYYNLNGQRVSRPDKGIYIVNGKKILFK
ncbi:MAG: C10 family peptidase [Muribaculaceae bacterium]|nr:C10 family peptidase [Muribaculaceae bacterium]